MKKRIQFLVLALGAMTVLSGCGADLYPRPTNQYYCNDHAEVLTPATEHLIVAEGENLYEWSEDFDEGGAQIVFATFLVGSLEDIAEYDKTTLFRKWGIGKNDMGILVIYFFVEDAELPVLQEVQIEIGYRMEQYLTPIEAADIVDDTVFAEDDLQMGTAFLLNELLNVVYVEAYDDVVVEFDHEAYQEYFDSYVDDEADTTAEMALILYLFSSYTPVWTKILIVVGILIFGGFAGGVVKNIGGGGSSGGMGIRRRR